ncbi:hypothetical protein BU25DRAFT_408340 [Macroventuria anomochaeta]|uniref:Uncharacterized protein n=1 Tax=Macroventuria anomochaeta TaxID=301207 RepID=A0ACB6S8T8_9PLEO|nr:uncharacterized protein BU25DRAFT_408340 [Macroventuria anomochaeta]KAF2630388.1 hypothetical protein BU25DRAFT_408340 [Macroventuria anomochaeta]
MSFDIVHINVDDASIPVYKDWISAVLSYFKKAFAAPFPEADDRAIRLDDMDHPDLDQDLKTLDVLLPSGVPASSAFDAKTTESSQGNDLDMDPSNDEDSEDDSDAETGNDSDLLHEIEIATRIQTG